MAMTFDATLKDMGKSVVAASTSLDSCGVETLAGDVAAAERDLRRDYEALDAMGEKYLLSTVAAELSWVLAENRRDDEAERYTRVAEGLADDEDLTSQALWRWVRAVVMAHRGQFEPALALAHEATDLLSTTDSLVAQADALVGLCEVAELAGRDSEARASAAQALELYALKGDLVSAQDARALLRRLSGPSADGVPDPVTEPAGA